MSWASFFIGFASGGAALWVALIVLVVRKLRAQGISLSSPIRGRPGVVPGAGLKEKVRVGEKVCAVLSTGNGKKRTLEGK